MGDNRNMLSLIALREANNLKDGTKSVYDIYNNAVSQVAVDTRSARANADTESSLLQSVTDPTRWHYRREPRGRSGESHSLSAGLSGGGADYYNRE